MKISDLDEGLFTAVAESFDKKVGWKQSFSNKYDREFSAQIDGTWIDIDYSSPDAFENTVEVSFRRNGEQSITGEGKAHVIFGAVINHINDFVREHELDQVIFTAHKPEGNFGVRDTGRSDLYRKMMKKLSNTLGFEYSVEDSGNNDIFTLTKKDRQIKEEQTPDIIDNIEGWGNVPLNQNVDYMGLRVKMKPSVFLRLAAPMDREPSDAMMQHIKNGGKIGSPFLNISIPPEWEDGDITGNAQVSGHEGRNRMKAILRLHGDIPIETHLFFYGGVRRRHLTDEMISAMKNSLQSQKSNNIIKGPLFSLTEKTLENIDFFKNIDKNKIKYILPNFEYEWEEAKRYPEFRKMGKEPWIKLASEGKTVTVRSAKGINNTDAEDPNSFASLDKTKQRRALKQLKSGTIEMPIVAIYSDGWKELVGGNTRLTAMLAQDGKANVWVFNVPDEVATLAEIFKAFENIDKDELIKNLTKKQEQEFINNILAKMHELVLQQGDRQSLGGHAFDISRYIGGVISPRKLEKMYREKYTNINEWGRIVKGVNTTPDVGPGEIKTQAAKFGNHVDRDGRPPILGKKTRGSKTNVLFNLGLAEGVYYKNDILLEHVIYEGFMDSAKTYLGNKFNQSASDIQGAVRDLTTAGVLIKDIVADQDYLVKVNAQLNKQIGTLIKQINSLSAGNQIISNVWNKIKNIVFTIRDTKNWKGFLGKLGIYGFLKFIVTNTNNLKDNVINLLLDKVTDLENIIPNATLGGFLQIFEGLQFVKTYFLDILTSIKKKLEFGKNLTKRESIVKMKTSDIFPDLGNELNEGPLDTLKKLGRGAALATSIGTAGTMGALGYDAVGQKGSAAAKSAYSQLAPSTSKIPKPRPQQTEPESEIGGSELAPEKSTRPIARPDTITLTDNPEEKMLVNYAQKNNITGSELAALMAQAAVETQGFSRMVEQGSKSYFNKYDPEYAPERASILGNKYSGDGIKYRGRGYVQLTGRYNYYRAGKALGLDLINEPDLAAEPENALKIALWYWNWRVTKSIKDFDNVKKVTYLINGGYHGLDKRKIYFDKYSRRINLSSKKTENKKYTALEMAIMEGGHTLEETKEKVQRKNSIFGMLMEGIRIQLERDDDLYVLHIKDSEQKHRVEVRGKSGYETGKHDSDEPLHKLIDNLGKAANISDLMNGEPVYINPDHPDGPRAIRYLKKAMNENKDTGIKVHNTSVMDHYRGESFGEKLLSVDGILKARIKLSILGDEVYIQHIETAEDSKRKGYAKQLVDDLFREFPKKIISVSMMTDSGSRFFRSQYNVNGETGELTQK